jgi:hypothetical protein
MGAVDGGKVKKVNSCVIAGEAYHRSESYKSISCINDSTLRAIFFLLKYLIVFAMLVCPVYVFEAVKGWLSAIFLSSSKMTRHLRFFPY